MIRPRIVARLEAKASCTGEEQALMAELKALIKVRHVHMRDHAYVCPCICVPMHMCAHAYACMHMHTCMGSSGR